MASHGQFRGGSRWHGVMAGDLDLDPRTFAVFVFESNDASRKLNLVDARLLRPGASVCHVHNIGTQNLTIRDFDGTTLGVLAADKSGILSLFDGTTAAGVWTVLIRGTSQLTFPAPSRTIWNFGGTAGATSQAPTNDGFEYNQLTDTWVNHVDVIPTVGTFEASGAACVAVFPDMFMAGGGTTFIGDVKTFRFTSSTLTGVVRADSPRKHKGSGGTVVDGKAHYYGGTDSDSPTTGYGDVYEYDDAGSGTWTKKMDTAPDRYVMSFIGTLFGSGLGYAYGGWPSSTVTTALRTMDKVEPGIDVVTAQPDADITRFSCGGAFLTGLFIYPCSYNGSANTHSNAVRSYDPVTMLWAERTPLSAINGAVGAGVVTTNYLGDKVWLSGGWGGDVADGLRTFEMTPGSVIDTWVEKQSTTEKRRSIDAGGVALQPSP